MNSIRNFLVIEAGCSHEVKGKNGKWKMERVRLNGFNIKLFSKKTNIVTYNKQFPDSPEIK